MSAIAALGLVTLTADRADAQSLSDSPTLASLDSNGQLTGYQASDGETETKVTGVGKNQQKMLIRLGAGLGYQTGFGPTGRRFDLGLDGVFEWNNLRFYADGGAIFGSRVADGTDASGWWLGGGAGYKLTLVGKDLGGLYAQGGGSFQSLSSCTDCPADDVATSGVSGDLELGLFAHNGNSQVHLAAQMGASTVLGLTLGATLRWEYRIAGFIKGD
jgi:hypothetical protein